MPNPPSPVSDDRIPVIVGVGEIVDRPKDISKGLEPLALLEQALKRAEADAGCTLLGEIFPVVTPVAVGPSDATHTLIQSGLKPGDRVIIGPSVRFAPNSTRCVGSECIASIAASANRTVARTWAVQ